MGTRSTINFKDSIDDFYVYRGHDGFPDTVIEDVQKAIAEHKGNRLVRFALRLSHNQSILGGKQ